MMMAGMGLGFVMPNLTVFAQETAGRALLGISTAMLQSVRMIGGMLGMALVGTLVTHYYIDGVRQAAPAGRGPSWMALLATPPRLVTIRIHGDLMAQLQQLGLSA